MGLLDDIEKLTKPASQLPDIEDDDDLDGTSAKKVGMSASKARAKFAQLNFEEGKYAGKKVDRKDMFSDSNEMTGLTAGDDIEDDSEEDEDEEEMEDEEQDVDMLEEDEKMSSSAQKVDDEDENEEMDEEDEDEEAAMEDEEESAERSAMMKIPIPTEETNTDKAQCIQNQRKLWDSLMHANIRMHSLLNSANQLPRGEARKKFLDSASDESKNQLQNALENMSKLRLLMKEACQLITDKTKKGNDEDEDDEEIPSDDEFLDGKDDEDIDDEEEDEDEDQEMKMKNKGMGIETLGKFLKSTDEKFDDFRSKTITKWYNRTKLLSKKSSNHADFSVFEKGSILSQISKIVNDEPKLLKKVRTRRSVPPRLGEEKESANEIDNELFDDADFYHVLLRQMIDSRSNNAQSQSGEDMTRNYIELQALFNNKKKRDVSKLSSKDRQLKYEPIAKLINFYPAKPTVVTWTHESRNELFKSLFC